MSYSADFFAFYRTNTNYFLSVFTVDVMCLCEHISVNACETVDSLNFFWLYIFSILSYTNLQTVLTYTQSPCCSPCVAASGLHCSLRRPVKCQPVDCRSSTVLGGPGASGADWLRRRPLPAWCRALPAASPPPAYLDRRITEGTSDHHEIGLSHVACL